MLINATADLCGFLNGTNKDPLSIHIFGAIKEALPKNFMHSCPYFGKMELANIYIPASRGDIYPDGLYNIKMNFFNNRDENIFLLKLLLEMRRTGLGNAKF